MGNEENITPDTPELQRIIRGYCEQLYAGQTRINGKILKNIQPTKPE